MEKYDDYREFTVSDVAGVENDCCNSERDGAFSFVTRNESLLKAVCDSYGRNPSGLCVKIFHYPLVSDLEDFIWGKEFKRDDKRSKLIDAVRVQNIAHFLGLAPRVYGIFVVVHRGRKYAATLMQYSEAPAEDSAEKRISVYSQLSAQLASKGCIAPFGDLATPNNVRGGQWVDFQGARFSDSYEEQLRNRYLGTTYFGNSKYQTVPGLVKEGMRDTAKRIADLGLEGLDFKGKTIIDIGSSGGMFCDYSCGRGAKYCIGVDHPMVNEGAREMSNYLGFYNIDFLSSDLSREIPAEVEKRKPFDIGFFLSMTRHIGAPEYLKNLAKLLIVEFNQDEQIEPAMKTLNKYYTVKEIGRSTDFGDRLICHCHLK